MRKIDPSEKIISNLNNKTNTNVLVFSEQKKKKENNCKASYWKL